MAYFLFFGILDQAVLQVVQAIVVDQEVDLILLTKIGKNNHNRHLKHLLAVNQQESQVMIFFI